MSIITIIGAGMMGSAMCWPAYDNKNEVRLVGTPLDREIIDEAKKSGYHKTLKRQLPDGVKCYQVDDIDEAIKGSNLIIGGVSSFGVEWFADEVLHKIPSDVPVLSITKGLHTNKDGSLIPFPEYIATKPNLDKLSLNAVGGPCISFELADRHNTYVAFCGYDMNTLSKIRDMLSTEYYHINITTDVAGVETAVAMKNAYALGVALAIGMTEAQNGIGCKEDYNPQAALFAQSIKEMRKIIALAGGEEDKIEYGAGDLYVTVFGGRTRMIGTLLGRGMTFADAQAELAGVTLESVAITKEVITGIRRLAEAGKADLADYPLLMHIYDMICNGITVDVPWEKFIK